MYDPGTTTHASITFTYGPDETPCVCTSLYCTGCNGVVWSSVMTVGSGLPEIVHPLPRDSWWNWCELNTEFKYKERVNREVSPARVNKRRLPSRFL